MTLVRADARSIPLASSSVQAVVTSAPYLAQRTYGESPLEGGHEPTLDGYVSFLADVFDELRRVLKPDGLAWLNLGDKANGSGGAGGDWTGDRLAARKAHRIGRGQVSGPGRFRDPDYHEGTFLDVPGAVLRELLRRDWRLRLPIVWDKGREQPESLRHVGRPRFAHEMIYLLAPGPRAKKKTDPKPRFYPSLLAETGSVWHFPPGGSGDPHLAPFPDELARRCILPSTLPGDLVFDPFDGSGTVRRIALEHGRRAVGADLYAGTAISSPQSRGENRKPALELELCPLVTCTASVGYNRPACYVCPNRALVPEELEIEAAERGLTGRDREEWLERRTEAIS